MAWSIKFIPQTGQGISVIINGEFWNRRGEAGPWLLTWSSAEGETETVLPAKYKDVDRLYITGVAHPWNNNVRMEVKWDGQVKQDMRFDNVEDHEVTH